VTATPLKSKAGRLLKHEFVVSAFHERSGRSVSIATSGPRDEALERARVVVHALVATPPSDQMRPNEIVRYYDVGLAPRVHDVRTGRSTVNVSRVLKGEIEFRR
jgi:hypothetical protein